MISAVVVDSLSLAEMVVLRIVVLVVIKRDVDLSVGVEGSINEPIEV